MKRSDGRLLDDLRPLIERFELEFEDPWLLREAFTHRSFLNEYRGQRELRHYERLEILGDAVIELVVSEEISEEFPDASEGELTKLRSILVCNESLSAVAEKYSLYDFVLMAGGIRDDGAKSKAYIGACVVEALIGAIYKDKGLQVARLYVNALILKNVRSRMHVDQNPAGTLQERTQAKDGTCPHYVYENMGSQDDPWWVCTAYHSQVRLGHGEGGRKKIARANAAKNALENFK